jgi:hypothetical protein
VTAVIASALILGGCFKTIRPLTYGSAPLPPHVAPYLLTSTAEDLNGWIANIYNATHSFEATTDMTARSGSVYRSFAVTEYNGSFTAYILFRKAADIRVVGKVPIYGTAFDMTSTGPDFRLSLPTKHLFVTGSDSTPEEPSANTLENLRPNALLEAILMRPADLATERIHMEDDTDVDHSWYILQFTRKGPDDTDLPDRSVWFDRLNLRAIRQRVFDSEGLIVSDTKYDKWQPYDGVMFPTHIDASFKKDGYGVVINASTVKMNSEPGDEKFVQEQPAGSTLKVLGITH